MMFTTLRNDIFFYSLSFKKKALSLSILFMIKDTSLE